jgi:hypothetical protein
MGLGEDGAPTPAQTKGWHSPSFDELGILFGIGDPGGS